MSTPAEYRRVKAELDALRAAVGALAEEWDAIDAAKPYAMAHIADCADDIRDLLDPA